jgi:hypothetical protein
MLRKAVVSSVAVNAMRTCSQTANVAAPESLKVRQTFRSATRIVSSVIGNPATTTRCVTSPPVLSSIAGVVLGRKPIRTVRSE